MLRPIIVFVAALGVSACAAPAAQRVGLDGAESRALDKMMRGESQVSGSELDERIAAAAAHPLGSKNNPVRAAMPQGQRSYLARLRCSDGRAPKFDRMGSYGEGVFGNIIDGYAVDCGAAAPGKVEVFMDMYHSGFIESRTVPGFTIDTGGPVA